ncbi:MAG: hypothetical protein IK954_02515 [Clostridia bacterium]|nr:hypothetical protein [Clostridia bacterium]
MFLSQPHKKVLKLIKSGNYAYTDRANEGMIYLQSEGLIVVNHYFIEERGEDIYIPELTQKGKAVVDTLHEHRIELWAPVVLSSALSIAAIVISVIALLI